jgi:hypothetical protein
MLQISADITALNTEQREAFAAFILAFPRNNYKSQHTEDEQSVIIPAFSASTDEGEQSPEDAFSLISNIPNPLPAAVVSIATAAVASPASLTNTAVVLDKNGLPWDERIHASSHTKNADGSWRTKRGVDAALVVTVESELKALMGIPAVPPAPTPIAVVPPPPPPPVPVAETPAAAVASPNAFVALISKASALIGANKLTQEELTAAVVAVGVPSLNLIASRPDLIPQVSATIDAMVAGR